MMCWVGAGVCVLVCWWYAGVADQADIWLDDQSEATGLRGGTEASGRDNDAVDHRDVPRGRGALPADADQDTLPVQPP